MCWRQVAERQAGRKVMVDTGGSSQGGFDARKGQHEFSWRDAMDIPVRWRQLSEPNDQVCGGGQICCISRPSYSIPSTNCHVVMSCNCAWSVRHGVHPAGKGLRHLELRVTFDELSGLI